MCKFYYFYSVSKTNTFILGHEYFILFGMSDILVHTPSQLMAVAPHIFVYQPLKNDTEEELFSWIPREDKRDLRKPGLSFIISR